LFVAGFIKCLHILPTASAEEVSKELCALYASHPEPELVWALARWRLLIEVETSQGRRGVLRPVTNMVGGDVTVQDLRM
jgi:hypothetical protein